MFTPILEITDGTDTVSLVSTRDGFILREWRPSVAAVKGGGVYTDSPMVDGRILRLANFDNAVESFDLVLQAFSQDKAIYYSQKLRRLLQKAREYWTTSWQIEPVWIKAKASKESNARYAIVVNWETPGDTNPFSQPFLNCPEVIMDEFSLTLERGDWMSSPPGSSACTMISGSQEYTEAGAEIGVAVSGTYYVSALGDSAGAFDNLGGSVGNTFSPLQEGASTGDLVIGTQTDVPEPHIRMKWISAIRFRNVTVPKHARIETSYATLVGNDCSAATNMDILVRARYVVLPEAIQEWQDMDDLYDNIPTVNYFTPSVTWTVGNVVSGTPYDTPSLNSIIQRLVDRSDWLNGADILLFFMTEYDPGEGNQLYKSFYQSIPPMAYPPHLHITYHVLDDTPFGQTETCTEDVVFVANKHNRANFSHIYRYDASLASYSGNLIIGAEGLPYKLLPETPEAGDILYIGISGALNDYGPFCNVIFDIGTAATGVYGHWEYYNGGWVDLTVRDEMVNWLGAGFTTTGVKGVFFAQPSDWSDAGSVNGIAGYWIRYIVDSVASPAHPHQQNRNPYTVVWPFVDIAEDEITGDLPAWIKVNIKNHSHSDTASPLYLGAGRVIMGLRTYDRGAYFTPYINLNDNWFDSQNMIGIFASIDELTPSILTNVKTTLSPSGYAFRFNPSDAQSPYPMTLCFHVGFLYNRLSAYAGTYRVFLRARRASGSLTSVRARFATVFARRTGGTAENYSEIVTVPLNGNGYVLADLGILRIIPKLLVSGEYATEFDINIYLQNTDESAVDVYFTDMILMPVDEWAGDFNFTNGLTMSTDHTDDPRLYIDSIGDFRSDLRAYAVDQLEHIIAFLSKINNGPIFLQSNRHQRLWFLFDDTNIAYDGISNFNVCHSVHVKKNHRYFSSRGNQ